MSRATPPMRDLAKRIIAFETGENHPAGTNVPALNATEKLRPQLATLMGNVGYRALLLRALTLAKAEVPWLREMQIKADGTLEGGAGLKAQVHSQEMTEGSVVLLGQLFGLLAAFIGENLTHRIMREIWPKLSLNNLEPSKGRTKK